MRVSRRARFGALLALAVVAVMAPSAAAAVAAPTGYDIAYPLCGAALPAGAAFGIVGVNGGLANNANPCLGGELAWAAATPGLTSPSQPAASLRLNTADPGNRVPDWPSAAFGGAAGATPFGVCDGSWSTACAYLYGALRAAFSYRLVAGANTAVAPSGAAWWLDIEQQNTWAKPTDLAAWAAVNIAAIKGFVAGLRDAGAGGPIGFYSTRLQWQAITGLDPTSSLAQFDRAHADWVAGVGSLSQAQAKCQSSFSGGPVMLAQFAAAGLDGDFACPPVVSARLRVTTHRLRGGALRLSGMISRDYSGRLTVALTAVRGGRAVAVQRSPTVVDGRWQVVLPLPRGPLRGGMVVVQSRPALGLLPGLTHLRLRLA